MPHLSIEERLDRLEGKTPATKTTQVNPQSQGLLDIAIDNLTQVNRALKRGKNTKRMIRSLEIAIERIENVRTKITKL